MISGKRCPSPRIRRRLQEALGIARFDDLFIVEDVRGERAEAPACAVRIRRGSGARGLPAPADHAERGHRLPWEGLAACLGVDGRQVLRWRRGAEPCGGAMLALCRLAAKIPGGLGQLLHDDFIGE